MKKTKIVCTLGPACRNEETLTKMVQAGMNVARLNFSHGDYEEHKKNIELIKKVREKLNVPPAHHAGHEGAGTAHPHIQKP